MRPADSPGAFACFDQVQVLTHDRLIAATWRPDLGDGLAHHFPLCPIVPGSMVLEAFAQLGSLLLESSSGFRYKALPAWIERARFRRPVPGRCLLELRVSRVQGDASGAVLDAEARQAAELCATARFGFVLAPIGHFYGPRDLESYRVWVEGRLTPAARVELRAVAGGGL